MHLSLGLCTTRLQSMQLPGVIRACHRYTAGQLFRHRTRTRTCEHRTRTAMGMVFAGNGYGFLRNPRCKGHPQVFSTIQYYNLLKKILIIYTDCCCGCCSRSYLLSKKRWGGGRCCCCNCCSHSRNCFPAFCPPSFAFTPPVHLCSPHSPTFVCIHPSRLPSFALTRSHSHLQLHLVRYCGCLCWLAFADRHLCQLVGPVCVGWASWPSHSSLLALSSLY